MPLGSLFQCGGLVQQKQVSPFPRRFDMGLPWAWHHWKAWEKERDWLPLGLLLHTLPSSVVTFLAFFSRARWPLGSLCPDKGESSTCLLMQWVTQWALGRMWALASPSTHSHPWLPSRGASWCGESAQCTHRALSHPQLQDEPCKLLFGCQEEHDSHESGSWRGGSRSSLQQAPGLSLWTQHGPHWHPVWPTVLLSRSIMERSDTPENFLHPDCKNRVKVGHFLCYFRAHSLLLKHIM